MDFSLSSEQESLVDMTSAFARSEVAPAQQRMSEGNRFPHAAWRKWSDLGMAGMLIPEAYSGSGLDALTYMLCLEELAAVSQTFAQIWQIHVGVSLMYVNHGTEAQKRQWLPAFAAGERTPSFALTEAEAGSDAGGLTTRARRTGDGDWLLNGRKMFISNAGSEISDGTVVMAVTGEKANGRKAITAFIVPRDTPGFHLGQAFAKMAWHGLDNHELVFEDVHLTDDMRLGAEGAGLAQALGTLNLGRIGFAMLGCGLARACLDEASIMHAPATSSVVRSASSSSCRRVSRIWRQMSRRSAVSCTMQPGCT